MLNLITGAAGTGKSFEMMARIDKAVCENKKVFIIVPDQFNFEYNRLLYNTIGMEKFNRTEVVSFSRLAKYIFIKHGGLKGKYADDTVRSIVMFRALSALNAQKALDFYSRQARSQRFINDALEFVKTFSANNISPERLADRTSFLGENIRRKAEDISLIYSEYSRLLAEYGYKDGHTDINEAAKKASSANYFKGIDFFIDEFKSFTPDEYEMLSVMIRDSDSLTVCLTTEDAEPKKFSVFETVNTTAAKLIQYAKDSSTPFERIVLTENRRFKYPELEFLSKNILRPVHNKFDGKCEAVTVYEAAEPYSEADFVCAEICRLVRQGYRYSDVVVMSRQKENYSSILGAAFDRCGIPFYSDNKTPAAHKALIIFIQTALKLASVKNPSTEDFLRYIKTGFTGLDTEQTDILEEYCYKWNVEGKMWHEPFKIWDKKSADNAELTNDEIAENARLTVAAPIENLRRKCIDATAATICRSISEFLDEVKISEQLTEFIGETESDDVNILTAVRESKQLWDMLCTLLQTLYRTLGNTELSLTEFNSLFDVTVSGLSISAPPQTLDAVQFSASNTARLANPKAVFVIGANEGILPFAAKSSALLSDKDISALKDGGIEISGSSAEKLAEERYIAYASLSGASERLYITYPAASISGGGLYPSLAVKQAVSMFENDIRLNAKKLGLLYFCTNEKSGYYQYVQNFKRSDSDSASLRKALEEASPENKARFEYLDDPVINSRHRLDPAKHTADKLFGKNIVLSASRLEDYRKCPFIYFCKKGLKIYPRRRVELNAPSHGNVIHYCLCEIMKAYSKEDFVALSDEAVANIVRGKLSEYYESDAVGSSYGKTKRYNAAYNRLADTLTDIISQLRREFAQSKFTPDRFEYTLSRNGDEAPMKLRAADGTEIYFIGAVDRVDTYDENGITYIRVVDYKSGTKVFSLEDLYYGINMQMLLYMFALTDPDVAANQGLYHAALPAGVLYMPAKDASPSLPRIFDEEQLEAAQEKGYKMDGLVLSDLNIVKAMESEPLGIFIPVKLKKDESFYANSKVITDEQLENLRRYSAELIKETSAAIKDGKIEADPLIHGKASPCSYCDYSSVCGNFPNITIRSYDPDAKGKMQKILDADNNNKEV